MLNNTEQVIQDQENTQGAIQLPFNVEQASGYLNISKAHLYKLTSKRKIPHYKQGKKLYFKQSELESWLFGNKVKTLAELEVEATNRVTNH